MLMMSTGFYSMQVVHHERDEFMYDQNISDYLNVESLTTHALTFEGYPNQFGSILFEKRHWWSLYAMVIGIISEPDVPIHFY